MTSFVALSEFTETGLDAYRRVFTGQQDESAIDPEDSKLVSRIGGTDGIRIAGFSTAKNMAMAILEGLGSAELDDLLPRTGLWAWLTFVLRDQFFKRDNAGNRKVGEIHRWYPSDPDDWQKGQRHLVRMPVLLAHTFGGNADHLLCGAPSVLPEIREQLTSQRDMFNKTFQQVARTLYFDDAKGELKRGAGGNAGGSPSRLAKVRRQLDVTWDLEDLEVDRIISMLPAEFDRFRQASGSVAAQ